MKTYLEQMKEALEEAKRTGKRVRRVFNREKFIREFPEAANDPRMAFTPNNFILDVSPTEAIDVKSLRELCIKKGNHPLAVQKALSVQGLADHVIVTILRQDMEVLRGDVSPAKDQAAIERATKKDDPPPAPAGRAAKPPK